MRLVLSIGLLVGLLALAGYVRWDVSRRLDSAEGNRAAVWTFLVWPVGLYLWLCARRSTTPTWILAPLIVIGFVATSALQMWVDRAVNQGRSRLKMFRLRDNRDRAQLPECNASRAPRGQNAHVAVFNWFRRNERWFDAAWIVGLMTLVVVAATARTWWLRCACWRLGSP